MNKLLLVALFLLIGAKLWAGEEVIEMSVATVTIDPHTRAPVVVLRGEKEAVLPIVIGTAEARAIALALDKVTVPRPMTHDLLSSLVEKLGARVSKIFIHDLRDGIFFAQVILIKNGERLILDSRPSDAIALALRTGSPIIVAEKIVTRITTPEVEVKERIWI
ncbi:bifunctional nuclease family protein [candidate division NPL-UPA2 bacterium Unc8]|uniref:Bifunctional nuclease family protein n=1 Tax=candidate division NPL-UPA2 bacterium Unc8 TaxID=1980939 RepID=A0A399FZZ3_UNCN2|nr:MAG: bifunctional nuclease family protein [candidate division NPL-UPA2 bacterium Unc8]